MACYDLFNGDADGICALHQLRLSDPRDCELVTGIKRDIALMERLAPASGDRITVLDISLDKNRAPLIAALEAGAQVSYTDHHFAGEIPSHASLDVLIDPAPETCTSLLIDGRLSGAQRPWAVVGAFGDNLHASARRAAEPLGYSEVQLAALEQLGTCLNYNGYGHSLDDLLFHPADLYRAVQPYADPFAFIAESTDYARLHEGYQADFAQADTLTPDHAEATLALYTLPDAAWARRVSGDLANQLARANPSRAHAMLTLKSPGVFQVSLRAPLENRQGADEVCRQFETGGGRAAAAGINALPEGEVGRLIEVMRKQYGG